MNFGRTAAKNRVNEDTAQLGVSSAGAAFIVIAFLSGLCFNVPEYVCEMLKDVQQAKLCARPMVSARIRSTDPKHSKDNKDPKFVVVVPQSVSDDVLHFDGVAK